MDDKKGLTLQGLNGRNFLYIIVSIAMIGLSIYLTSHFYDVLYPTKLGGAVNLCNFSNFFNCDAATYSHVSNIAGVPIAFFGVVVGLLFLFSSLMPSVSLERTASAVAKYNFIGCIALFIYSLVVLGSLCPFCTVYYVLSGIAFFLFWKYGINSWMPDFKVAGLWALLLLIGFFAFYTTTKGKAEVNTQIANSIVKQFRSLPSMGDPEVESKFKIHMATENFADAPIRISVFSDFQCPYCKVVAEQIPELVRRYPKSVNVQYFFFPLDSKCNSNMKGSFHAHACDAAMLAACSEEKFVVIHDDIFSQQEKLGRTALNEIEKKYKLKGCMENKELRDVVINSINQGVKFNLKSTPTIIINGKKIEGTIPNNQFFAIFEDILSAK